MDGPPNAVAPKRRKEVNNCVVDGRGLDDIFDRRWPSTAPYLALALSQILFAGVRTLLTGIVRVVSPPPILFHQDGKNKEGSGGLISRGSPGTVDNSTAGPGASAWSEPARLMTCMAEALKEA